MLIRQDHQPFSSIRQLAPEESEGFHNRHTPQVKTVTLTDTGSGEPGVVQQELEVEWGEPHDPGRLERHARMARRVHDWVGSLASGEGARGEILAPGHGPLKETCIRIGHMGDQEDAALRSLLVDLGEILAVH